MNSILSSTVSLLFDSPLNTSKDSLSLSKSGIESFKRTSHGGDVQSAMNWIGANGKKWLEEAMNRLGLDYSKVSGKQLIGKSTEQLSVEKNKVKNELKRYDANFVLLFRRQPGRAEKEPMRPLYVYYKKIKQALGKSAQQSKAAPAHGGSKQVERKKGKAEEERKQTAVRVYNEWSFKTNEEIKEKIAELKNERGHLRGVLDKFQQEFVKTYNRKIKYNKDIAPVSNQFKRYKDLKKIIVNLEEIL